MIFPTTDTAVRVSQQVWDQLQEPHWLKSVPQTKSDAEIFGELLRSVDARYALLESTLEAKELTRTCQPVSDIKLNYASPGGICVESRQTKLLPFEFHMAVEVLWRCLRQGKVAMFDCPATVRFIASLTSTLRISRH